MKLTKTCHGWKSPTDQSCSGQGSEPAVLRASRLDALGQKRRQGSCGVRIVGPERWKVAEAETVRSVEGRVCIVVKRRR